MSNIPINEWQSWFAWYPLLFKNKSTGKYDFVFLSRVSRRLMFTEQNIFQYEYTTEEVLSECI